MSKVAFPMIVLLVVVGVVVLANSVFVVSETQQVVLTQFGQVVGEPITEPGLHFRKPFVQTPNYLEKRVLEWDGNPNEVTSKDRRFITVDTFARWRIADARLFFQAVNFEAAAQTRLDDILDGATRSAVANHLLIELLRNTRRALPVEAGAVIDAEAAETIEFGRTKIAEEILAKAQPDAQLLGIEVLDLRFKRINYEESVRLQVYERMRTERQRIAAEYRAEGEGEAAKIRGRLERDMKQITSDAYREAEEIRGDSNGEAARIYSEAFNVDPEFYRFYRTLQSYKETLDENTMLLLSTEGDFLKYLQNAKPE